MQISINQLRAHNIQALKLSGYEANEINILLEHLMYAQLRGNWQSIIQFVTQGYQKNREAKTITIIKETPLSALLDGHANHAILVMHRAMEIALVKAKEHGFSLVGTKGSNEGSGALGFYVQHLANHDLIGWAFSGSSKRVAPFGSYEPLLGTNPIAIGIPTSQAPLVLDMATAAVPFFKIVEAHLYGHPLPEDIAYNSHGKLTNHPDEALHGAIRGMDFGPKGSGLALMIEALTGPLVEAVGKENDDKGNLILAIDPELLTDRHLFKERMSQLKETIKSAKKLPHVERIFVPGERGDLQAKQSLESGYINIQDELFQQFQQKLSALEPPSLDSIILDDFH